MSYSKFEKSTSRYPEFDVSNAFMHHFKDENILYLKDERHTALAGWMEDTAYDGWKIFFT